MKYSEVSKKVVSCINADVPALMWGPPGCGKSALGVEIARDTGRNLYDIRFTSLEPPDLTGLQQLAPGGKCTYARPDILPPLDDEHALLFLDELMAARREMQPIAYQLVHDRRVGSHKLPRNCVIVAASNRIEDRAISERVSSALASRMSHYTMEADALETARHFLKKRLDPRVAAFLNWRPALIHTYKPDLAEHAFGCPRTWEMSAKVLGTGDEDYETHAGIVGQGQAAALMAFLRLGSSLPNPLDAINDPNRTRIPTEPDQAYAMVCAVGSATTPANSVGAMTYLLRYKSAEYIVLGGDVALSMQPTAEARHALTSSKGWQKYATDPRIHAAMGIA